MSTKYDNNEISKDSTDVVEESTTKKLKTENQRKKELESYLGMNNWKLSNDVKYQSLKRAFLDEDECMKFLQDFLYYNKARVAEFDKIERKLPRDRNHELYYDSRT